METLTFENDITAFCIKATSFPNGVMAAHKAIHALVPGNDDRIFFGLSRPEKGVITYWAGAEELREGEAEAFNCETIVLKKGKYICTIVTDFMQHVQNIGGVFQALLSTPGIDPQGYCVEWYFNDTDVRCMVRLGKKLKVKS